MYICCAFTWPKIHICIKYIQWWFVYPGTFVPGRYFRINKFSGLLNRPLVRTWTSVPTLFVRTSEIFGLSEPGLTNHHCTCKSKYTPGLSRCIFTRGCIFAHVQINFYIYAIAFTCQKIHPGANYTYMYNLHTVCKLAHVNGALDTFLKRYCTKFGQKFRVWPKELSKRFSKLVISVTLY